MRYTMQSIKYVCRNFIYLFPLALMPAFFLSLSTDGESIYCAIETLFSGTIDEFHFSHLFRAISVLNFSSWKSTIFGVVAIILLILCVAMIMALLDKHMRIGKRTYNGLFSKINDNLVSTSGYGLLLIVIYELWALILSAFLYFFAQIPTTVFAYVLSGVFYLIMHILLIYLIGLIYLWLPCMQITGFRSFEALRYSYHLVSSVKWSILLGQLFFLLLGEAVICLCAFFISDFIVFTAITTVLYAVLIMVYCVRMMVAYFDRDQIERADLKRYYQR